MSDNGIAKIQHYVPQFILKNFMHKKNQVHVFDKKNGRIFSSNTKNVASENHFYNFILKNGSEHTWEVALSELEGEVSVIIDKIIDEKSLKGLSDEQKYQLALFLAVQFVRTRDVRENFKDIVLKFSKVVSSKFGEENGLFSGQDVQDMISEDSLKLYTAELLAEVRETYLPYFLNKLWALYEAPKGENFYIGDNPVSRSNFLPSRFGRSNLGLAVKGTEIYFPISSKYCLALLCPELIADMVHGFDEAIRKKEGSPLEGELNRNIAESEKTLSGLLSGGAYKVGSAQVIHCNCLQVIFSNTYIFSSMKSFDLVKEMINDNEKYKNGMRGSVR